MSETTTPTGAAADAAAAEAAAAPERLATLRLSGLVGSGPDPLLERATRLASRVLRAPVSLLSIVSEDRQSFVARTGIAEPAETPLSHSFCKHVVARDAPLQIADARSDPLVAHNGAVRDLDVIAYLGVPVHAPDGHPLGSFCAIESAPRDWTEDDLESLKDIAAGVESEIAARIRSAEASAAEARLRAVLEVLPIGVSVIDARTLELAFINASGREITGRAEGERTRDAEGRERLGARRPSGERIAHADFPIVRAARTGEHVRAEPVHYERPDGGRIEVEVDALRIEDAAQGPLAVAAFRDVTALNAARRDAEASAERLEEVLQATTDAVVVLDADWHFAYLNDNAENLFGSGHLGRSIWEVFPVAIGGPYWESLHDARATGLAQQVSALLVPIERWIEARAFPSGDELTVFFRDVTEARAAEEDRKLLVHELNHRVKNLFAVVSGMVGMTARVASTPQQMARDLRGRIGALAAAHELIRPAITAEEGAAGADLGDLVAAVLRPHLSMGPAAQVAVEGPPVALGPGATTALALALHELATNAAKYGALRGPEGRLGIAWRRSDGTLALDWIEEAGSDVPQAVTRPGFGSTLLALSVRTQLGGELAVSMGAKGIEVHLDLPLDRIAA